MSCWAFEFGREHGVTFFSLKTADLRSAAYPNHHNEYPSRGHRGCSEWASQEPGLLRDSGRELAVAVIRTTYPAQAQQCTLEDLPRIKTEPATA